MKSRVLAVAEYDDALLGNDTDRIIGFPCLRDPYTEFVFGHLHMHVLWNNTGRSRDNLFCESGAIARPTELGIQLPYLNSILEKYFKTEKIIMVRANLLFNCLLVPHRDYTEIESGYSRMARVHLPIHTNVTCLNSEETEVFHMRKGEIWWLNVGDAHAAYCPTDFPRISIMIDFYCENENFESLFKDPSTLRADIEPHFADRPPMDDAFYQSILGLGQMIEKSNFTDVIEMLSKIHFYRNVPIRAFYDWLDEICVRSGDALLIEKSKKLRTYFSIHREINERFSYEFA
jgi:hypothetical protein